MARSGLAAVAAGIGLIVVVLAILLPGRQQAAAVPGLAAPATTTAASTVGPSQGRTGPDGPAASSPAPDGGGDSPAPGEATAASTGTTAHVPAVLPAVAPPADPGYSVRRIDLNGQDLADLNELAVWKFRFRVPQNQYTQYVWMERWTRDSVEPEEVRELATLTGVWHEGDVVVKLPTEPDARLFVRTGTAVNRKPAENPVQPPTPWRLDVLENQPLADATAQVYLMTYTFSEESAPTGGLRAVHNDHDVTVYIKMRFSPGEYVPFDAEREALDTR